MIVVVEKMPSSHGAPVVGKLELDFSVRQKRHFTTQLQNGEEVSVRLPRGVVLRGGDLLCASNGCLIEVIAAPQPLLQVEASGPGELTRLAYHLGNRHVAIQVGDGFLRIAEDSVLERMLLGLGANVAHLVAPFEPEAGAYTYGHRHGEEANSPGRIHEYGLKPIS